MGSIANLPRSFEALALSGRTRNGTRPAVKFAPTCSVVVCTCRRPDKLANCLSAIQDLRYPAFEVIVVDIAPVDGQSRAIAARYAARYLLETQPGLSRARNRAAAECDSEIVAFIDDDETADCDWLSCLVREFGDPRVMAVAGRILPPNACEAIPAFAAGDEDRGDGRLIVDRKTLHWFEFINFDGIADGGHMAFRRSAFDIWPGFDVRLGRGTILRSGEERHAFFSMVDRGYRVVYTPRAVLYRPSGSAREIKERHLSNVIAASAYMALLLAEEPCHRTATIKYLLSVLSARRRALHCAADQRAGGSSAPLWREILAALHGLALYLRSRLERQESLPDWNYVPDFDTTRALAGKAGGD